MGLLLAIGKFALVILAIASVALPLISERRNYGFVWQIWKRFRFKMLLEVLVVVALTIATMAALWVVPGLKYGWTNLFFSGSGNMLVKPIMEGSESTNLLVRLMVPLFFIILILVLPFLAISEERNFRKGYEKWGPILKQSVKFGLMHCLVGVPLAAGIALILTGLFYGYKYKRTFDQNTKTLGLQEAEDAAVMVSTTYHTMYNTIVVALILLIATAAL